MMDRRDFSAMAEQTLVVYRTKSQTGGWYPTLRMTSGTSSGAPVVFIRGLPNPVQPWFQNYQNGLLCVGSLPMRFGHVLIFKATAAQNGRLLVVDNEDLVPEAAALMEDFKPQVTLSFPSILARAGTCMGKAAAGVALAVFTGELLKRDMQAVLNRQFPNATLSPQYMIQEVGNVSEPERCIYLPAEHYHPDRGVEMEIFEPDETGAGEIMLTVRVDDIIKLTKYRYGDLGRIDRTPCSCGAQISFEILGRVGADFIRFGGATLRREEFDRAFALCKDVAEDYRAELSEKDGRGVVTLYVKALKWGAADEEVLRSRFSKEVFLTQTQTLADLVKKGIFAPLEIRRSAEPVVIKGYKDIRLTLSKDKA